MQKLKLQIKTQDHLKEPLETQVDISPKAR